MTREEAIDLLSEITMYCDFTDEYGDYINDEPYITALDMAIKALELVDDFERARIITGGRLNGRTQAYKCGLADGQRQTSWIPVSEKPQEGRYLCTYEHYDGKCIDFGSFDGEKWYIKPIAYMPLPQPYKAERENQ